jgi:hypothetical protein
MALIENWHIRSRARECAATGRPFDDGESIVAAIFPDPESSGYLRKDFCADAWKNRSPDDEAPFSFWRTTFVIPQSVERAEVVQKESAEDLFRRLVEEDEEHTDNVRYILAVMLERQKIIRETDNQRTPTGILRVYEHRRIGDVFLIKDPDIPLSKIDEVQADIIQLLESGGRQTPPSGETQSEPETPSGPEAPSEPEAPREPDAPEASDQAAQPS